MQIRCIVLLLVGGLLAACSENSPPPAGYILDRASAQATASSSRNGRYVIAFSPATKPETFLVDTQKGRVWQLAKFTELEGEPTLWKGIVAIDDAKERADRIPGSIDSGQLQSIYPRKAKIKSQ
jgi:hypothetical protein